MISYKIIKGSYGQSRINLNVLWPCFSFKEISDQELSKLKEYSKDIPKAKYIYDLYLCKMSGVNHVEDCF